MEQNQNNNPLMGFVNAPRVEIRVSFTEAELNDMKKYLTGKDVKRVYLTIKTGEKKDKSGVFQICSIYDPSQGGQSQMSPQVERYAQSHGVQTSSSNRTDDLPF